MKSQKPTSIRPEMPMKWRMETSTFDWNKFEMFMNTFCGDSSWTHYVTIWNFELNFDMNWKFCKRKWNEQKFYLIENRLTLILITNYHHLTLEMVTQLHFMNWPIALILTWTITTRTFFIKVKVNRTLFYIVQFSPDLGDYSIKIKTPIKKHAEITSQKWKSTHELFFSS